MKERESEKARNDVPGRISTFRVDQWTRHVQQTAMVRFAGSQAPLGSEDRYIFLVFFERRGTHFASKAFHSMKKKTFFLPRLPPFPTTTTITHEQVRRSRFKDRSERGKRGSESRGGAGESETHQSKREEGSGKDSTFWFLRRTKKKKWKSERK